MQHLLEVVEFRDPTRARREITDITDHLDPSVQTYFESLLGSSPDPDRALNYLTNLHHQQPSAFRRIASSTAHLRYLVTVFSHSHFLSDELMQNPRWIEEVGDLGGLRTSEQYEEDLLDHFANRPPATGDALLLALFRRRHILHILLRDVLGFASLPEVTEELSNLADAILEVSYQRIRSELIARYGVPRYTAANGERRECGMAVIALGKLGGQELNYSSDVDLMFVYS